MKQKTKRCVREKTVEQRHGRYTALGEHRKQGLGSFCCPEMSWEKNKNEAEDADWNQTSKSMKAKPRSQNLLPQVTFRIAVISRVM